MSSDKTKCCAIGAGSAGSAAGIYAELKKMQRRVDDADILIAAFCKCWKFSLVTNNTKHFAHIQGLTIVDWTKHI